LQQRRQLRSRPLSRASDPRDYLNRGEQSSAHVIEPGLEKIRACEPASNGDWVAKCLHDRRFRARVLVLRGH
jgi:hypothetical protein